MTHTFRNILFLYKNPELGREFFSGILTSRLLEEKIIEAKKKIPMDWPIYQALGQEACGIGITAAIPEEDEIMRILNYRGLPYLIGRKVDLKEYIRKTYISPTEFGENGPLTYKEFPPFANSLGAHFGIAIGRALAIKQKKGKKILICVFGDGTATRGTLYGALNLSALWKLPILWVCEKNDYSVSASKDKLWPTETFTKLAGAFGIESSQADGNDVIDVYMHARFCRKRVVEKSLPHFLELKTYRLAGHSSDDRATYRKYSEIYEQKSKDPLTRLARELKLAQISNQEKLLETKKEIQNKIEIITNECIRESNT